MSTSGWYLHEDLSLDLRDSIWYEMAPEDSYFKLKLVFTDYAGGSAVYYDENNKIFWGPYDWSIKEKILNLGDLKYTIVYVDNKKLVVDIKTSNNNLTRRTYTHTPKKL